MKTMGATISDWPGCFICKSAAVCVNCSVFVQKVFSVAVPVFFICLFVMRVAGCSDCQESTGSRAPGLKGSRAPGLKGPRAPGLQGSRVQGLQGSQRQSFL